MEMVIVTRFTSKTEDCTDGEANRFVLHGWAFVILVTAALFLYAALARAEDRVRTPLYWEDTTIEFVGWLVFVDSAGDSAFASGITEMEDTTITRHWIYADPSQPIMFKVDTSVQYHIRVCASCPNPYQIDSTTVVDTVLFYPWGLPMPLKDRVTILGGDK